LKIGIITFHNAINYGAVFQALALQKVINKYAECEIIDYRCSSIEDYYRPFYIDKYNKKDKYIKLFCLAVFNYSKRKYKIKVFNNFLNRFVKMSKDKYYSHEDLKKAENDYDLYISGSDQIWNYILADFDKAYFLDFVTDSSKKNSYAASFGFEEIPHWFKNKYYDLLHDYNNISVREKSGVNIVKDLLDRDVDFHIDPVFFLSKNEWMQYADIPNIKDKYILLFTVKKPDKMLEFARVLSKEKGLELVYINDNPFKQLKAKYLRKVSPSQFLGLIYKAEYVITNSFHGMAYSVIMQKKFFVEINSEGEFNHRIYNMLNLLGLEHCIIKDTNDINCSVKTDYQEVSREVDREKNKAINYLKTVIGTL